MKGTANSMRTSPCPAEPGNPGRQTLEDRKWKLTVGEDCPRIYSRSALQPSLSHHSNHCFSPHCVSGPAFVFTKSPFTFCQFLPSAGSSWKEAAPNACVCINGATHPTGSVCLLKTQTFSPRALPHTSRGAQGASDVSAETWRCQGGAARAGHSHEGEVRFPTAALSEPSQLSVCPR